MIPLVPPGVSSARAEIAWPNETVDARRKNKHEGKGAARCFPTTLRSRFNAYSILYLLGRPRGPHTLS